ncbi:MAG TPA: acyltransferase [Gaiellaceae bacterium]|jgi:peptidoglycan/LPS O-acetylase OafA/YrhL
MTRPRSAAEASPRLEGIEALRALAALGVLSWHVWSHPVVDSNYGVSVGPLTKLFDNGRAGVAMFFVLSGFLLYRPFAAAIVRGTRCPSIRRYFINRVLRILPAYWVVLLVVAACFQRGLLDRPLQLLANMLFLQDFVPSYVPGVFTGYGIAPAWSLCVEVIFYLALPLLALVGLKLYRRGVAPTAAALAPPALMLVSGVVSLEVPRATHLGALWEMGFPDHMHWFALGMFVAVARVLYEDGRLKVTRALRISIGGAAIIIAAGTLKLAYGGTLRFEEEESLLSVSCALVLALVVLPPARSLLVRMLAWPPFVYLGLISYSIFLWHEPVLRFLREQGLTAGGTAGFGLDLVTLTAITLVLATLTYVLVERPALSAKDALGPVQPRPEPAEWSRSAP